MINTSHGDLQLSAGMYTQKLRNYAWANAQFGIDPSIVVNQRSNGMFDVKVKIQNDWDESAYFQGFDLSK